MKNNKINCYYNLIQKKIYKKYSKKVKKYYNLSVINNILEKGKCHIVAVYKEFLLYYDYMEFLKRFYKITETRSRLINISYYYKENSIIFPNYSPLIEYNYLYNNIRKKQILKNKIINNKKKLRKSKKRNKDTIKDNNNIENDNNFFSNTIYNDILNESESFTNLLFGIERNNKDNENNNYISNEIEEEIEDFEKIISIIHHTEIKKKRIVDLFIGNNEKNKKIKYKKTNIDNLGVSTNNIRLNKKRNSNKKNNSNSLFIKSMNNSTASGSNSVTNTIQNQKFNFNKKNNKRNSIKNDTVYQKIRVANKNTISKTNIFSNNDNNNDIKVKPEEEKKGNKIIYHRKVKSTLVGGYSYKLDLTSNISLINSLKTANKRYAENNNNKNIIRVSLFKKKKKKKRNNENIFSNSLTKTIGLPEEILIKEPSSKIIKNIKTQMLKTPQGKGKEKENLITKLTRTQNSIKLLKIPIIKTPIRINGNKINSPIYTRNHIPGMYYNNSNKDINDRNTIKNNPILNSCKKPENIIKNIYINQNITSPYSKPKGINKDRKNIGVSGRKLFNHNYYLNLKNDKNI